MDNFHSLEVVCRGSETQLQVGENYLIYRFKGYYTIVDRLITMRVFQEHVPGFRQKEAGLH